MKVSSQPDHRPSNLIGITMGCPVGIGPEIILRFLADTGKMHGSQPVVLGDVGVLARCAKELAIKAGIVSWQPGRELTPGSINVMPLSRLEADLVWGKPDQATGRAMAGYIEKAVELCQHGNLAGMATCPITKTSLQAAGYHYPGHTEMLASLCGVSNPVMMMAGSRLRVTLVTIHTPLADVAACITRDKVLQLVRVTGRALRDDFGVLQPRMAVAGLNPHAGESGMFGDEEKLQIAPAVSEARDLGWDVRGPFPPDTVFHKAMAGEFDAVICMYHDQGLIPFKLFHFADGVNVTLGLPIVRTSVDHGTAYDIAGKGLADPSSLAAAVELAAAISANRQKKGILPHGRPGMSPLTGKP